MPYTNSIIYHLFLNKTGKKLYNLAEEAYTIYIMFNFKINGM